MKRSELLNISGSKGVWSVAAALGMAGMGASQTTITVDAQSKRHAISPNVYGTAYATQSQMADLNFTLNRYGGNNASRYNWSLNCDNRGSDWFFESIADTSSVAGERADTFISTTKNGGGQPMITIPMINYIGKLGASRGMLWSFSKAKYGSQSGYHPYRSDAGNGISASAGNPFIHGNNPLDANVANNSSTQLSWIDHMISAWGLSSANGVKYYIMDNEPSLWNSTHRDVHPTGEAYTELYNDYVSYAGAVRGADQKAVIFGPEEWGWTGYFYSGYDAQYASVHGWGSTLPDRSSHANMDHIPWLLKALKNYQNSSGKQLLNVLSVHYYPQQGEFSNDDSASMRAIRNRSTRSLWDPAYVDTSWINSVVELIPRLKSWIFTYYPGLQTAITEYNWGDEAALNGATAQADVLGIFGREGLDYSSRWTTPATNSPAYLAMKIYRNYDGLKSGFGDTSVSCSVPNPDNLSAFAAQRTSDGALTVMVVNKSSSSSAIKLGLSGFLSSGTASVFQISSPSQTSISHLSNVAVSGSTLSATVPSQSITLFVLPAGAGAQYDFESGAQGWGGQRRSHCLRFHFDSPAFQWNPLSGRKYFGSRRDGNGLRWGPRHSGWKDGDFPRLDTLWERCDRYSTLRSTGCEWRLDVDGDLSVGWATLNQRLEHDYRFRAFQCGYSVVSVGRAVHHGSSLDRDLLCGRSYLVTQ